MVGLITKNGNFLYEIPPGYKSDQMIYDEEMIKLVETNNYLSVWAANKPSWLQVCTLQNRINKERIIFVVGGRVGHSISKLAFTKITSYEMFLTALFLLESL